MDIVLVTSTVASAFCFALALVLTQFGLRRINPFLGASVSLPTTALLFIIISPLTLQWNEWHNQSAMIFAAVGLVFPVAVTLLTFHANRLIGPNLTGTLGNLTPFFAVIFAVFLLGEIPHGAQWLGIVAICCGVTLLFLDRSAKNIRFTLLALGLPLSAAILRGAVQPFVKMGLTNWANPFAAVTIGYLVSTIVIGGFAIARRGDQSPLDANGLVWFAAVGIINGIAVLLLYSALGQGPVTIVAPLVACYPMLTLIFNRLILRDHHLSRFVFFGIVLTVMGIGFLLVS